MTADKILKQLTNARIKKELAEIQAIELPEDLQKWVKEYEKVGDRNPFIWKWLFNAFSVLFLIDIPPKYKKENVLCKFLIAMYIVVLDDIGEKKHSQKLLKEALLITISNCVRRSDDIFSKKEEKTLFFIKKIWKEVQRIVSTLPLYKNFSDIFEFDIYQVNNSIRYSLLANLYPQLNNITEAWLYLPANMAFVACTDIDLMCADISADYLLKAREIIYEVQKIGMIDNWIATWEREALENDFSNGILAFAFSSGIIKQKQFIQTHKEKFLNIIKKSAVEKKFIKEWWSLYGKIIALSSKKYEKIKTKELLENLLMIFKIDLELKKQHEL